jgi:hypothetical protein
VSVCALHSFSIFNSNKVLLKVDNVFGLSLSAISGFFE